MLNFSCFKIYNLNTNTLSDTQFVNVSAFPWVTFSHCYYYCLMKKVLHFFHEIRFVYIYCCLPMFLVSFSEILAKHSIIKVIKIWLDFLLRVLSLCFNLS